MRRSSFLRREHSLWRAIKDLPNPLAPLVRNENLQGHLFNQQRPRSADLSVLRLRRRRRRLQSHPAAHRRIELKKLKRAVDLFTSSLPPFTPMSCLLSRLTPVSSRVKCLLTVGFSGTERDVRLSPYTNTIHELDSRSLLCRSATSLHVHREGRNRLESLAHPSKCCRCNRHCLIRR